MAATMPSGAVVALRPVTVITGASSGIGRELALLAAKEGEVLLLGRNEAGLADVARAIGAAGGRASLLVSDGSAPDAVPAIMAHLARHGMVCDQLVNNAGIGFVGLADALAPDAQMACVDLNVRFATALALAVLPGMLAQGRGGILNVGSVAGFLPGPGMTVYYATKAYLRSLSEGLWHEVAGRGVRITLLSPGPVNTRFLERATGGARASEATLFHVDVPRVAQQGWEGFRAGRAHVIPGLANRLVLMLAPFLPRKALGAMIFRRQTARRGAA
ncbi:MAG: SDR family NAD(P)-dependent oxidoreductase [Beijerinckiaceae bacterium]|nr:SDR family NAD(P)-dependent oxidoreductase [Beijerinckiaceae bacterium]